MQDPHLPENRSGPQYLEDLATAYWFSETLFTAVELGIFTLLEPEGKCADEISQALACTPQGIQRFLHALCAMGLLHEDGDRYFNTTLSRDYLVAGKPDYQGESILWRKSLTSSWTDLRACLKAGGRVHYHPENEDAAQRTRRIQQYINAMDGVARTKVREMLPLFDGFLTQGELLDAGAGSGAVAAGFLERIPLLKATLLDLPEVLEHAGGMLRARGLMERVTFTPANILEPWCVDTGRYDIVVLSNIIHAYSEDELPHILSEAARCLKENGIMVIHDFFFEHYPEKAALFDLNMFVNTYNGKVFSERRVLEEIKQLQLDALEPVALGTDTALIIAAKNTSVLSSVRVDAKARLVAGMLAMGFRHVRPIAVSSIHVADWTDLRCRFGCERFGSLHCPPHSPSPEKTRRALSDYSDALLIEGEPPTKDFQQRVLQAEREAFIAGFYKAFALWAGPCSLCGPCIADGHEGKCRNPKESRPSMEGSGIDVFETARRAGFALRTLRTKDDFVKYYALLLLE